MPSSEPGTDRIVFTIGHSTRSIEEFLDLLTSHRVQELADVRRFPGSRRNPQYSADALAKSLGAVGIGYTHMPGLGGRRGKPRAGSLNTGWRVPAFQAYADWMEEPEWRDAFETLLEMCRGRTVACMCAEAVPWRCHRRLIADALTVRGFEVRHILGADRTDPHRLPEFARVLGSGEIIYDGASGPGDDEVIPREGI